MTKLQFLKDNKDVKVRFTEIHKLWSTWVNNELKIAIHAPVTSNTSISSIHTAELSDFIGYDYDPEDIVLYVDGIELE